ncbi:MAG: zeta toxin family protein [Desulfohalobiaceae bacterium]
MPVQSAKNRIIIIAGPNGAGKTTCARQLLQEFLQIHEYLNADQIALELYGYYPKTNVVRPGKVMLQRMHELVDQNKEFAFETTLAPRSFARWIRTLISKDYVFILHYVFLQSPELAVQRVLTRIKVGGHPVPENVVRRRYWAGIANFFKLYSHLAHTWMVYDNSGLTYPQCIAYAQSDQEPTILEPAIWNKFRRAGYAESNLNTKPGS